jgi:hypothetical protein
MHAVKSTRIPLPYTFSYLGTDYQMEKRPNQKF